LLLLFGACAFSSNVAADPWGKDADLCHIRNIQHVHEHCSTAVIGPVAEGLIAFHQQVISPADGPRSHFLPSSSQYTLLAMRKYGFYQGFTMGCDRLMRENDEPWVYKTGLDGNGKCMKLDPVR